MNDRQKRALINFSVVLVVGAAAYFVWLFAAVVGGYARGDVWPGKFLMLLIVDWNSVLGAFKGLAVLIAGGIAYVGAYKIKNWIFYAIVGVLAIGFLATSYLFFEVTSVSTAKKFWAYSPMDRLQDYHSFVTAARVGLGIFCSWFIGILGSVLGVRIFGRK